jgi:hypothetical protein
MLNLPRNHPRIKLGQLSYNEHMKGWNGPLLLEASLALYINACAHKVSGLFLGYSSFLSLLIFKYGLMPVMPTNPSVWSGMQH